MTTAPELAYRASLKEARSFLAESAQVSWRMENMIASDSF